MNWRDMDIEAANRISDDLARGAEGEIIRTTAERAPNVMTKIAELAADYPSLVEHIHAGAHGAYEAVIRQYGEEEETFALHMAMCTTVWLLMQYAGLREANEQVAGAVAEAEETLRRA